MKLLAYLFLIGMVPAFTADTSDCDTSDVADTAISAALGEQTGLYDLGVVFYTGRCVKKSYEKAAFFWEKAVALGDVAAKNNLGYLLSKGLGVSRDETKAVALWKEAATAGHSEAQVHLGDALFNGRGVLPNRTLGLAWVLRAIKSSKTRPDTPDGGGGNEILSMAEEMQASMQAKDSSLLQRATDMAEALPGNVGKP